MYNMRTMLEQEKKQYQDFPRESPEWYLEQYLTYGSVEEVFKAHRFDIKTSVASYHRLVKNRGIVKASGRRDVSLSEMLQFFVEKALEPALGLETIYREKMPPSFQTSLASLHRIYNRVTKNTPHRYATALVIYNSQEDSVLMGQEVHTHRFAYKHKGDYSLPMTFSNKDEDPYLSVLRVFQQEILAKEAISGNLVIGSELSNRIITPSPSPFLLFDILDVRVSVYELNAGLLEGLNLSSYKLADSTFVDREKVLSPQTFEGKIRTGIEEIVNAFGQYKYQGVPTYLRSELNTSLLTL